MMRGLELVDDAGEPGGVQMRSMAAVSAFKGGMRGGSAWALTDERHLPMAARCAQCIQWLPMEALSRQ